MKTTDSRDPLDRKIDDLLASRPLTPSDDFAARVLAAADELPAAQPPTRPVGQLLRFALPIAAAIAVAITLTQFMPTKPTAVAVAGPTLNVADVEEIFLLEEGLTGLTQLQDDNFSSTDLLSTLDALTFEIES
jgi:hypothetical protein